MSTADTYVRARIDTNTKERAADALEAMGLSREMTMRQFWDQHSFWTKDILEKYPAGISPRARLISASHHIYRENVNPYGVPVESIPVGALVIGLMENYLEALEERALMALDVYQAAMTREGGTPASEIVDKHEFAIGVVRKVLGLRFKSDAIIEEVISVIDELGREGGVFGGMPR